MNCILTVFKSADPLFSSVGSYDQLAVTGCESDGNQGSHIICFQSCSDQPLHNSNLIIILAPWESRPHDHE